MLLGTYQHNIDAKGRMFIPAKFRDDLGCNFYLTKGQGQCIYIYSREEWEKIMTKISEMPFKLRNTMNSYFGSACRDVDVDKQGRVVLPAELRKFANLTETSTVTIIGANDHGEIWLPDAWLEREKELNDLDIFAELEKSGF